MLVTKKISNQCLRHPWNCQHPNLRLMFPVVNLAIPMEPYDLSLYLFSFYKSLDDKTCIKKVTFTYYFTIYIYFDIFVRR